MSLFFPPIVAFPCSIRHWACRNRKSFPVGKLTDHAKQISPSGRLAESVVNRIRTGCFCALYQSFAKANFFDFSRLYAVLTDMVNPILRPDELVDRHPAILRRRHPAMGPPNGLTFSREPRESSFGTWISYARGSAAERGVMRLPHGSGPPSTI